MTSGASLEYGQLDRLIKAFESFPGRLKQRHELAMAASLERIASRARTRHKFKSRTGKLEEAVKNRLMLDPLRGIVFLDEDVAPYAKYVHGGTKPHTIYPKNGNKRLRFDVGGDFVFAREVHHPGTKADPFLQDAVDSEETFIFQRFVMDTGEVIREVFR